jgi:YD repeat-containing protein
MHARDNHGRRMDYLYDNRGRLVEVSDNGGHSEQYIYDSENRMVKIWWERKLMLTNGHDEAGHLVRQTNAVGENFLYTYNGFNASMDMAHFTGPDGYTSHFYFRSLGGTTQSLPESVGVLPANAGH